MRNETPAVRARGALRSALAKLAEGDWQTAVRRLAIADSVTREHLAGQDKLLDAVARARGAAQDQDVAGTSESATEALALLDPVIAAEKRVMGAETCDRCGQENGTHVRFGEDGEIEVFGDNCFKADLENLPAVRALTRTYRLLPAVFR